MAICVQFMLLKYEQICCRNAKVPIFPDSRRILPASTSHPKAPPDRHGNECLVELLRPQQELIVSFGRAQMVRTLDGKIGLRD